MLSANKDAVVRPCRPHDRVASDIAAAARPGAPGPIWVGAPFALAFGLACLATPAWAGGFQSRSGSPDWAANAFAGMAAKGYDASTAWSNPAAMTRLSHSEIDQGINLVLATVGFSGQDRVGGTAISGSQGGNAGEPVVIPVLEAVWRVNRDLSFGIASEAPFGQRTAWPGDFVGRYQALVSSITDLEIGVAAAYRITPTLSIGGGPIFDRFTARLTSALNTGPLGAIAGDPVFSMDGSDWAFGYHLGLLWEPAPAFRLGIDYRSRITEAVHGTQQVTIPAGITALSPATAAVLGTLDQGASTQVTVPDVLTVSTVWQVTPGFAALATVQWTDWSLLQTLSVAGSQGATSALPLHLRDSWLGTVGANWRPTAAPRLLLQGGVGYERGPVPDASRTPRLPGLDVVLVGLGATYAVTPKIRLQASYLHEFGLAGATNSFSATPSAGVLTGSYRTQADVISVGMAWQF